MCAPSKVKWSYIPAEILHSFVPSPRQFHICFHSHGNPTTLFTVPAGFPRSPCSSLVNIRYVVIFLSENESSLFDLTDEEQEIPQYTIIPGGNARGGVALVGSNGHRYSIKMVKPNVTYWRCIVRSRFCNCRAVVIQRGNVFTRGRHRHLHRPNYHADAVVD